MSGSYFILGPENDVFAAAPAFKNVDFWIADIVCLMCPNFFALLDTSPRNKLSDLNVSCSVTFLIFEMKRSRSNSYTDVLIYDPAPVVVSAAWKISSVLPCYCVLLNKLYYIARTLLF